MNKGTKNTLILFTVLILIVGGALYLAARDNVSDYSAQETRTGELSPVVAFYDFGEMPIGGGLASTEFALENNSSEEVRISKVYTSCMCTTAYIIGASGEEYGAFGMPGHGGASKINAKVDPGERALVKVVFDPAAHGPSGLGLAERSVYLETNSTKTPNIRLSFRAAVVK